MTVWFWLRWIFGIVVVSTVGWRLLRGRRPGLRDLALYGTITIVSLWILIDPSVTDRFFQTGLRALPLGRLVVLLLCAQLAWLIALLVLRERSEEQAHRHERLVEATSVEIEKARGGPPPDLFKPVMVVLPAYREERNIGAVLDALPTEIEGRPLGVVVVVDGADDPTASVVRRYPHVVLLNQVVRIGSGAALRLGYRFCAEHRVEAVVSMDSDGQHDPADLPTVLAPILAGTHDVVVGNRALGGWEVESMWRFVGLHLTGFLTRTVLRTGVWDCSNTYRAFRLPQLMTLQLEEAQYHTLELVFKAHRAGLRMTEVPVRVHARRSGESKKGGTLYYGYQFMKRFLRNL